ncbi:MAG: cupin domain-containing protein [Synechococcaceae cyanobacterium RL_1_2]|nr:cupin domain-containing protein [Synechococcaceae cyanobacterium RL_1_2]
MGQLTAQELITHLGLERHVEGGYFSETYRSLELVNTDRSPQPSRSMVTSIYYLLTKEHPIDYLHVNKSPIIHYFQGGSTITYYLINPDGQLETHYLGLNVAAGEKPQLIVPGGYWKTAVLLRGDYGLIGEAVAPGFEYEDMAIATTKEIKDNFPKIWPTLAPYIHPEHHG